MAVVAPYSKHKLGNFRIFAIILVILGVWFAYDGYMNKKFIEKHTEADGTPSSTLVFNQKSPPLFIAGAVVFGVLFFVMKNKKITADDSKITDGKNSVDYSQITKIDKTHLQSKGYFVISYKGSDGSEKNWKITDKKNDNISELVDFVASKIS